MTQRISRSQLQADSNRKHVDAVESWLRAQGWAGRLDSDRWPIVYADWYYGARVDAVQAFDVNLDALKAA